MELISVLARRNGRGVEDFLTAEFDAAIERSSIHYSADTLPFYHEDRGVHFKFRVAAALKQKPAASREAFKSCASGAAVSSSPAPPQHSRAAENNLNKHVNCREQRKVPTTDNDQENQLQQQQQQEQLRPGTDIDTRGYEVGLVTGPEHFAAFNKFSLYRPQLLVLTNDAHRRQYEALDAADVAASHQLLRDMGRGYAAMFNCGIESSCSRLHKHVHVIPCIPPVPPPTDELESGGGGGGGFRLWPDWDDARLRAGKGIDPPFQYRLTRLEDDRLPSAERLSEIYASHLAQLGCLAPGQKGVRSLNGDRVAVKSHNLVICHRWVLTIPRRHADFQGLGPNAAGMLGLIWVSSTDKVSQWIEAGPLNVLAHCGVPHEG